MDQIKALRDETGVSVMQVKKALEEAGGDMDKARMALRKKSGDIAAKKGDRGFGAGTVAAYVHNNGTVGAMVILSCETDFVAKNEDFKKLAYDIAMHVAAVAPKYTKSEDINEADKEKAKAFFVDEVEKTMAGKPEAIKAKALEGKISAYFKEMTLLDQPFIKTPELTIGDLIKSAVQKFGENTAVTSFSRMVIGK